MKLLVFDTETTGIIPKIIPHISKCPHILQFSYIIYDLDKYKILEEYNRIIHISKDIEISSDSISIHGINKEKTNKSRTNIINCLINFDKKIKNCDIVVGHNIDFDLKMVNIECYRNNMSPIFNENQSILCTMKEGIELCKIEAVNSKGSYFKWPKLIELHEKLFKSRPSNLHDAYNDILICLRCACFIIKKSDIYYKDSVFKRKIKNLL